MTENPELRPNGAAVESSQCSGGEGFCPIHGFHRHTPSDDEPHPCKRGASAYYCPTVGEVESDCHGGFDVCCGRPDLHIPVTDPDPTVSDLQAAAREQGMRLEFVVQDEPAPETGPTPSDADVIAERRAPAYAAVRDYIRHHPGLDPTTVAIIWRAMDAALDAMGAGMCDSSHCVEGGHVLMAKPESEAPDWTNAAAVFHQAAIAGAMSHAAAVNAPPDPLGKLRTRAEQAEAALAALHAGEEEPADPRGEPTPGQWIWRWNRATPEQRLDGARRILDDADRAYRCVLGAHDAAVHDGRAAQAAIARVLALAAELDNGCLWTSSAPAIADQIRDALAEPTT